jgi:hypothetical protein
MRRSVPTRAGDGPIRATDAESENLDVFGRVSPSFNGDLLETQAPFGGPTHRRPTNMPESNNPFTTGAVARLLSTTEPRVAETVRRGRIIPEPTIVAGRRLWTTDQIRQAAEVLGVPVPDLSGASTAGGVQ